jgi:hypothetical protein
MSTDRLARLKIKSSQRKEEIMPATDRLHLARESYRAFAAGDRSFFEEHLCEDFTFSSPPDAQLDRHGWFERCWPGAGRGQDFEFLRLVESGTR